MPADGGEPAALTDPEMMDVACPGGRIELRGPAGALVLNNAQGTVELLELGADGGHALLVHGDKVVTGAAWAGGSLLVSFSDPSTAGDLAVLDDGQLRLLTDFSAALRVQSDVIVPQELTFASPDGYPGPRLAGQARRARARTRSCCPSTAGRSPSTLWRSTTKPRSTRAPGMRC